MDGQKSVAFHDSSSFSRSSHRHSTPKSRMSRNSPRGLSPPSRRMMGGSPTRVSPGATKSAFASEVENNTISKQRKELQLLIVELKDRDRELNEMVSSHQKQLMAWEEDRQRVLALEQRCSRLEGELATKNEHLRTSTTRLKTMEAEDAGKGEALNQSQAQLNRLNEQQCTVMMQVQDLEEKNRDMNSSMRDMSSTIGELEAKEQELLTMLRLKDKDLMDASNHISELSTRLKMLDFHHKQLQQSEAECRRQNSEINDKNTDSRRELERLKGEIQNIALEAEDRMTELQRARQEIAELSKDLALSSEREKRKDEVINLQRSKMERTDAELTSLRQAYDRQLRDLSMLHLNLESSKDLIAKQQASFNDENGFISSPEKSSPRRTSSPLPKSSRTRTPDSSPIKPVDKMSSLQPSSIDEFTLPASRDLDSSPTSKLQRLLTESRNMVHSMEKATYTNGRDDSDDQ